MLSPTATVVVSCGHTYFLLVIQLTLSYRSYFSNSICSLQSLYVKLFWNSPANVSARRGIPSPVVLSLMRLDGVAVSNARELAARFSNDGPDALWLAALRRLRSATGKVECDMATSCCSTSECSLRRWTRSSCSHLLRPGQPRLHRPLRIIIFNWPLASAFSRLSKIRAAISDNTNTYDIVIRSFHTNPPTPLALPWIQRLPTILTSRLNICEKKIEKETLQPTPFPSHIQLPSFISNILAPK